METRSQPPGHLITILIIPSTGGVERHRVGLMVIHMYQGWKALTSSVTTSAVRIRTVPAQQRHLRLQPLDLYVITRLYYSGL